MFTMTIKTDNAAFAEEEGGPSAEVARILRQTAERIEAGFLFEAMLFDYNGNRVGEYALTTEA